jgi:hypothetical protein
MNPVVNEKLEKLALKIQGYLLGSPAILIGSGCSVPYGLPSMSELSMVIISQLNDIYCSDDSWKEFINVLEETKNLETALECVAMNEIIHDAIIDVVWADIVRKDNEAFLNFIKSGQYPEITKILYKCVQSMSCTNIITTNYDRLIEYSIDAVDAKCITGFVGNYLKRFQTFEINSTKRVVNLYKVHGSVDWFKHKSVGNTIATNFRNVNDFKEHYYPMIVTPGIRKYRETHNDPFRTVISEADKAIRNSLSYLCVGYGFNDEHIQPIIIEENRNKKKPIVIVTKTITEKMKELFLSTNDCKCLILSESSCGGTQVHYSKNESEIFEEPLWQLNEFCKLWLG